MSARDFLYAFSYLTSATLLFPVGLGVASWARLSPSLRVLTLGLGGYFVILLLSILASHQKWDVGQTFGYCASLLYGLTFTTVYALAMPPGLKRWLVIGLGAAGIGYELFDMLFLSGTDSLDGFSIPIMTLILVISTLIFLVRSQSIPHGKYVDGHTFVLGGRSQITEVGSATGCWMFSSRN